MEYSMISPRQSAPADYTTPPFPSLHWPPQDRANDLKGLHDIWRFTTIWTIIIFLLVHLGAAGLALTMHLGNKRWSNWRYVWVVPIAYAVVAGTEALMAGSAVGLMLGAVYISGPFNMSTWIPFIWGWINVLVLIISSFSIQGGL